MLFTLLGGLLLIPSSLCIPTGTAPSTPGLDTRITKPEITEIGYCAGLSDPTIETTGDPEQGHGFWITNHDDDPTGHFFLYENSRDWHPWKYLTVPKDGRAFVSVCPTWQGRVVRGVPSVNTDNKVHSLGTWFQSAVSIDDGRLWAGISFLEGCDGGGSVSTTDGSNVTHGCVEDLLTGAPSSALATKDTGTKALGKLVGLAPNGPARDWELSKCSPDSVWIDNSNNRPIVVSADGKLEFIFHKGKA
ncbi:hypothetical protein HD806DRAFT_551218 [Xylariaceae sp. AK1471]|nr:hypothetical protein HD806DRAFT_551218 [Xylariaceae sp. AK1471]